MSDTTAPPLPSERLQQIGYAFGALLTTSNENLHFSTHSAQFFGDVRLIHSLFREDQRFPEGKKRMRQGSYADALSGIHEEFRFGMLQRLGVFVDTAELARLHPETEELLDRLEGILRLYREHVLAFGGKPFPHHDNIPDSEWNSLIKASQALFGDLMASALVTAPRIPLIVGGTPAKPQRKTVMLSGTEVSIERQVISGGTRLSVENTHTLQGFHEEEGVSYSPALGLFVLMLELATRQQIDVNKNPPPFIELIRRTVGNAFAIPVNIRAAFAPVPQLQQQYERVCEDCHRHISGIVSMHEETLQLANLLRSASLPKGESAPEILKDNFSKGCIHLLLQAGLPPYPVILKNFQECGLVLESLLTNNQQLANRDQLQNLAQKLHEKFEDASVALNPEDLKALAGIQAPQDNQAYMQVALLRSFLRREKLLPGAPERVVPVKARPAPRRR